MGKFFKFIIKASIITGVILAIIIAGILFYYYHDLPTLEELESKKSSQTIQINYSNDSKITTIGDLYDNQVTFDQIPKVLIDAVVATEDRKFFNHVGIDFLGIVRASYVNYKAKRVVQGGSTITQQLAKLIFLKPDRTFKRKIEEMLLAFQLEQTFSKEQILTLYLNRAYFGSGNYGVASATKYYFGKKVSKINLNEAAMLAGLLKAPSKLSPTHHQTLAEGRANQVLSNMIDAGYLGEDNVSELDKNLNYNLDHLQRFYFVDYVSNGFDGYISDDDVAHNKHLIITTTLDEKIQAAVESVTNDFVERYQKKLGKSQIALVVMGKDGEILGLVGGKDYQTSPFNRAISAKRQAGSAFKTFVFLTAFQNGLTPDDIAEDKKVNVGNWSPDNYESKYHGEVLLRDAFALSLNSVAVQLVQKLDKGEILKNARKMGVISNLDKDDPTVALGTAEVTLLDLVSAYTTIANDGFGLMPYGIKEIRNDNGEYLFSRHSSGFGQIISTDHIIMMKDILRAVVQGGTGRNANIAEDIYGKTGTSQNFRDAWFVGFDDNYTIGVWIGNDDNSPTNKITGGSLPAELFAKVMKKIR